MLGHAARSQAPLPGVRMGRNPRRARRHRRPRSAMQPLPRPHRTDRHSRAPRATGAKNENPQSTVEFRRALGVFRKRSGSDLLSRAVYHAVPSALESLTSVFGMGTGVTSPVLPPGKKIDEVRSRLAWCPAGQKHALVSRSIVLHSRVSDRDNQAQLRRDPETNKVTWMRFGVMACTFSRRTSRPSVVAWLAPNVETPRSLDAATVGARKRRVTGNIGGQAARPISTR